MNTTTCIRCQNSYSSNAFRKLSKGECVWCQWESPERRALARFNDKVKLERVREARANERGDTFVPHLKVTKTQFLSWYLSQPDECHYCGLKLEQLRELQLRRGVFGYSVSWDIDRKDPKRFYERGNLALACFMCNMAKGSYFDEDEAKVLGQAIRKVVKARLKVVRESAP